MQLTQSLRQDMRQVLTPRMIQSMEILQLPLMALEQRIEQELEANPVLELREPDEQSPSADAEGDDPADTRFTDEERPMVLKEDGGGSEDFARLEKLAEYLENEEFHSNAAGRPSRRLDEGERDKKLDAMANTAARSQNLTEHLLEQWRFVECPDPVRRAGEAILRYIDEDGYLRTPLEQIQLESRQPLAIEDLREALKLVQTLEPSGVGARDLAECLLIQLDDLQRQGDTQGHDLELERKLLREHARDLELNRYPQISRKLGRDIHQIQAAVRRLRRLHPRPGRLIGGKDAPAITPDAVIYRDEETGKYEVRMNNQRAPALRINGQYQRMLKDRECDKKTRDFLANNVRNARWLIESLQQRDNTILRVIRAVVEHQRDFLDHGPEHLRPLPMIQVADQLGIHVATVSRAVSEKWVQTPRGIYPLRRFFSGGTTSADGEDMSWDAVKEKLRALVEQEDKRNPLKDDELVAKLKEQGIDIARRTVAKYRKILKIPPAGQRRQF